MTLNEVKTILQTLDTVDFILENGTKVPEHFHVTEVGYVTKHFIDCGGTVRKESVINFQLWNANDVEHRLKPVKLLNIIALSEKTLQLENAEIEVEYQNETIGRYALDFNGKTFVLKNKKTDCLAQDACGVPTEKIDTKAQNSCCTPGGGCC